MGEARGGRMQTGHSKWAKTLLDDDDEERDDDD